MYFEVKARYDRQLDNGAMKKVTEPYIVDALSFAEAEARAIDNISPMVGCEVDIRTVKRTPIAEVYNPDSDKFFLTKVAFISFDERTGAEKKIISQFIIGAEDIDAAKDNFEEMMRGTASDYELLLLCETGFIDIFLKKTKN